MPQLSLKARLYIAVVVAAACALIGFALGRLGDLDLQVVVILLLLHIVGESLLARGSRDIASISLGSVTSLAAIFMVGTWGAVLVAWSAALARDSQPTPGIKRMFNGAQLALSAGAAGVVYQMLGGHVGLRAEHFPEVLLPILAADVVGFSPMMVKDEEGTLGSNSAPRGVAIPSARLTRRFERACKFTGLRECLFGLGGRHRHCRPEVCNASASRCG